MTTYTLKAGATLHSVGTFKVGSTPTSIAAYTVTCVARNGSFTDPHTITATKDGNQTPNPGKFTLDADTSDWTPGVYFFDIKFAASGDVKFTESVKLVIEQPNTFVDP